MNDDLNLGETDISDEILRESYDLSKECERLERLSTLIKRCWEGDTADVFQSKLRMLINGIEQMSRTVENISETLGRH